jgi:hypothetical protein
MAARRAAEGFKGLVVLEALLTFGERWQGDSYFSLMSSDI